MVADVITVPKGCETAIETALAASVQDIITDSVEDAKRAVQFLKDNRAGRATFLPLESMRASGGDLRGEMKGAVGIAADLIDHDTQIRSGDKLAPGQNGGRRRYRRGPRPVEARLAAGTRSSP